MFFADKYIKKAVNVFRIESPTYFLGKNKDLKILILYRLIFFLNIDSYTFIQF